MIEAIDEVAVSTIAEVVMQFQMTVASPSPQPKWKSNQIFIELNLVFV